MGDFKGRPEKKLVLHDAVCAKCGNDCKVPFKPTGSKPILCADCFGSNSNRDSSRGKGRFDRNSRGGDRGDRNKRMYKAICDECGDKCELPFAPSKDKPIYCSNCFSKKGGSSGVNSEVIEKLQEQVEEISSKLDTVLTQLAEINAPKKVIQSYKLTKEDKKSLMEGENSAKFGPQTTTTEDSD